MPLVLTQVIAGKLHRSALDSGYTLAEVLALINDTPLGTPVPLATKSGERVVVVLAPPVTQVLVTEGLSRSDIQDLVLLP